MSNGSTLTGLARLLASENSATDLLVLLMELDASLIPGLFELDPSQEYSVHREVSAGGRGRLDLVIADSVSAEPKVALEMKGASSIHGDQLERYVNWAEARTTVPKLYFCAFDKEEATTDGRWTRIRLRDVYSVWLNSAHSHARWLATQIVALFDLWDSEADGQLGDTTGYYVNDIVTKRIARALVPRLHNRFGTSNANATRDNAGNPMIFAWAAHPRDRDDCSVSIGVDLRTVPRRLGGTVWKLRPNVEVDIIDGKDREPRTRRQSQLMAYDLASTIRQAMTGSSVKSALAESGNGRAAAALTAGRFDGFKSSIEKFDFDAWKDRIEQSDQHPGAGPFGHDRGLRLATILDLDVSALSRYEIEDLVVETVAILHEAAVRSLD